MPIGFVFTHLRSPPTMLQVTDPVLEGCYVKGSEPLTSGVVVEVNMTAFLSRLMRTNVDFVDWMLSKSLHSSKSLATKSNTLAQLLPPSRKLATLHVHSPKCGRFGGTWPVPANVSLKSYQCTLLFAVHILLVLQDHHLFHVRLIIQMRWKLLQSFM